MGLARKGSRAIHVEGHDYRWTVSPDSGCMWIIVERAAGTGQRMEACVSYADEVGDGDERAVQRARVSPRAVSRAITHARAEGWQPEQGGLPPFRLDDADAKIWDAP